MSRHAVTVNGLVPVDELGTTLPHEHLLCDLACRYSPAPDEPTLSPQPCLDDRWRLFRRPAGYRANLDGTSVESAIREAMLFREAGGRTIVDLTPRGLSPDAVGLKQIATATGLNVIASTGFYVDAALPDDVRSATVEQLTQMLIDDVVSGGREQIRRGAIGEIGIEGPTELELRCVRAAGRAQKRTGAPVFLHVMSGIFPQYRDSTEEVIGLYKAEGGDLRKLVLCHQDGSGDDQNYQARVLERGIWMEYDTFGFEGVFALGDRYIQLPTDTQRISEVAALVKAGFSVRLLLSQDICYQMAKCSWGGWGFIHLMESLKPRFAAAGVDARTFDSMMRDNPAEVFGFA